MKLTLDPNKITVGDIEDFEEATGSGLMEMVSKLSVDGMTEMRGRDIKALIWIARRQDDPSFTLEQTRAVTLGELQGMEVEVGEMDPTAGGEPSS